MLRANPHNKNSKENPELWSCIKFTLSAVPMFSNCSLCRIQYNDFQVFYTQTALARLICLLFCIYCKNSCRTMKTGSARTSKGFKGVQTQFLAMPQNQALSTDFISYHRTEHSALSYLKPASTRTSCNSCGAQDNNVRKMLYACFRMKQQQSSSVMWFHNQQINACVRNSANANQILR